MSRLQMTVSRLLALGGLTAASGSVLYSYGSNRFSNETNVAKCRRASPQDLYEGVESAGKQQSNWDDDWDHRKPKSTGMITEAIPGNDTLKEVVLKPSKPTATRHIFLIRHGQYVMDCANREDKILTELGRQQAATTGERLKSLNIKFDKMTVSTMVRAQETGEIIAKSVPGVPVSHCSLLKEGAPCRPDPEPSNWFPKRWEFHQDSPRIEAAFRAHIHRAHPSQTQDSYELLVCHGNVIRYIVCRALQLPPSAWLRMSIANCGITWLTVRPNGKVSLRGLGDVGHLPPEMVTYT